MKQYQIITKSSLNNSLASIKNSYIEFLKPVLLILILILASIIIYNYKNPNISPFTNMDTNMDSKQYPVNLPANDIHFISDDNEKYIFAPILNFKFKALTKNNKEMSMYLSVFQHKDFFDFKPLGQYCHLSPEPIELDNIMKTLKNKESVKKMSSSKIFPRDYQYIWSSPRNNVTDECFTIWRPLPQPYTVCMSDIIVLNKSGENINTKPPIDLISCIPIAQAEKINFSNGLIWSALNDKKEPCFCWSATDMDYFRCSFKYDDNMSDLLYVYNIKNNVNKNNTILKNIENQKKVKL